MATAKYNYGRDQVKNQRTGLAPNAYFADLADFDTIAEPAPAPATAADAYKITTAHTFLAGPPAKGFIQCYHIIDKASMEGETFGAPGALNDGYKTKIFIPGDGIELQAMLKELLNKQLIVVVVDPDGNKWQLGTKLLPAQITTKKLGTGTILNGEKGYELEVQAMDRFLYTGDITLMP